MSDIVVTHQPENSRYVITVDGAQAGFADYARSDGLIDFNHTEVDDEFQGRGLASQLIGTALDEVRGEGVQVRASCSFVAKFIEEHREYADLLAPGR